MGSPNPLSELVMHVRLGLLTLAFLPFLAACPPGEPLDTGDTDGDTDPDTDVAGPGELAQSSLERNLSPGVSSTQVQALSEANRDFAFGLYQELKGEDGNLFLSPHSVSTALAMTYAGANGATEDQIATALHFDLPEADLHPAFNQLDLTLESRQQLPDDDEEGDAFQLSVVNGTFAQDGYALQPAFLDTLAVNYGAGVYLMDFAGDPEGSREAINTWVEDQTNDRILDLLAEGSVTPDTRLVLANAIYFKASWQSPFEASLTTSDAFALLDSSSASVPTMHGVLETSALDGDGFALVELPYLGAQLSMTLIVPDAGQFATIESGLDRAFFDAATSAATTKQVTLSLPKFSFRTALDLVDPLQALGMTDAFSGAADFSGITDPTALVIAGVVHQAFVDVNEEGTEAAAATAVIFEDTSVPEPQTLVVDRPFLFAIRDRPTGAVLFVGRVVDPR